MPQGVTLRHIVHVASRWYRNLSDVFKISAEFHPAADPPRGLARRAPLQFESQTDVVSRFLFRTLEGLGKLRPGWDVIADNQAGVVDSARGGVETFWIIENKVSASFLQCAVLDSVRVVYKEHDVASCVDALRVRGSSSGDVNRGERLSV